MSGQRDHADADAEWQRVVGMMMRQMEGRRVHRREELIRDAGSPEEVRAILAREVERQRDERSRKAAEDDRTIAGLRAELDAFLKGVDMGRLPHEQQRNLRRAIDTINKYEEELRVMRLEYDRMIATLLAGMPPEAGDP